MSVVFWVSYVILWILVVTLTAALYSLYYHFGQMYLNSREGRQEQGPAIGEPLPGIKAIDYGGRQLQLPDRETGAVLLFVSESCKLCQELRAEFATGTRLDQSIYVFADGARSFQQAWMSALNASHDSTVVPDTRGGIATALGIDSTPFCVVVDDVGISRSKGNVNKVGDIVVAIGATRRLGLEDVTIVGQHQSERDRA